MNGTIERNGYPGVFKERKTDERKTEERRAKEEDFGAWKIVCAIWNKVAFRRFKKSRRKIDSTD